MRKIGFDHDRYVATQSSQIRGRIERFGGKLYLEFGGKLFDDYHAARVLPGFRPDSKVNMLARLADQVEIVIAINASDIEKNKLRGDLGITYDLDLMRQIDAFREIGLYVGSVVMTRFAGQSAAIKFRERLERLGVRVYRHYPIEGYPSDVAAIVSDEGYGRNDFIETSRPLVVVTAPGPGSGKMATCLSQLYHEHKRGVQAGYAKFETFPIWNLPLKHPVNVAYEAATADLSDVNMIDPYHLEAYGVAAVNYNRDVEIFPVLSAMFERIFGACPYKSPTDMGVNMAGDCISDDAACRQAAREEIVRRHYQALSSRRRGDASDGVVAKTQLIMSRSDLKPEDRRVAVAARARGEETQYPAAAIELPDGRIVTGKTSPLLGASAAALLNALKAMGGIEKERHLIPPEIIEPVQDLKVKHLGNHNPRLHTDEALLALSIAAVNDEYAATAMRALEGLCGCEVHSTVILSQVDENVFRKLGMNLTCDPVYQTKKLYHK